MPKIVWDKKTYNIQNATGMTIQKAIVEYKEHFEGISLNFSPMKVLKRNPSNLIPSRCIQVSWDYVIQDEDEIEFFLPSGAYDLGREKNSF